MEDRFFACRREFEHDAIAVEATDETGAIQIAKSIMDQPGLRLATVEPTREGIQALFLTIRSNLIDHSHALRVAVAGGAVKIAVLIHDQSGWFDTMVSAAKIVEVGFP